MAGDNVPEARKQMINLMYLVLTALLALNVTREVLTAFNRMNESITRSNQSINKKSEQMYAQLEKEMETSDSLKVKPWYEKSLEIKAKTNSLMEYVSGWKDSLISKGGGYELDEEGDTVIKGMDNINIAYNVFVNKKHGEELRDSMDNYINYALGVISNTATRKDMEEQFPLQVRDLPKTQDNPSGDWSYGTFHNIPLIAAVATLSKFQNDIKNSESMILEYLIKQVHAKDYKFNALQAIAVPSTTYALEGQTIEAQIMLAAYNEDAQGMTITSSAGKVSIEKGVGHLKFTATGVGTKTVNGQIVIEKNGVREEHPYHFDYMVGTAGASLQLDKMNVMYIGVDNPITLSASGYNVEDVSITWGAGGGVKMKSGEGKGHYLVEVTKPGTVTYKVMARTRQGGEAQVGGGTIRVKRIPDPIAEVAGTSSGLVKTARAKIEMGVVAELKNFDFDTRFRVTGFQFIWVPQNGQPLVTQNDGALWSETVQQYIRRSQPGDRWIISDVRAVGPDGESRKINSVVITLN